MPDTQFITQANYLFDCLGAALDANPNPPANRCLTWGTPIADLGLNDNDCCDGSMYVSMIEYYPSSNLFPDRTVERQSGPCGVLAWAVRFEVAVFRCWPDEGMQTISCATRLDAVTQLFDDAQAIRTAMCCFQKINQGLLVAVTDSRPLDPMGGCAGNYGSVSVQVPNCNQC